MKVSRVFALTLLAVAGLANAALADTASTAYRFSELKSLNVENRQNEKLGAIEDLLYNPQSGQIDYAVVGMGGFLGVGEKLFAVPIGQFQIQNDAANNARRIVLDRNRESLKNAPAFDPSKWPTFSDRQWSKDVDQFYSSNAAEGVDARASQLVGINVENDRGENLGKIDDIVVDFGRHRIGYEALSFGTTLGMGGKLFAVPFNNLHPTQEKDSDRLHIVYNVDKQQLEKAPGFDKNQWPNVAQTGWSTDVDAYYHDRAARANTPGNAQPRDVRGRGPQTAFRWHDLRGLEVKNAKNEQIGTLESLAVESKNGKIRYAVIGAGGFIGIGETFFAVPWQALQMQYDAPQQKHFLVWNIDKARLDQAPHFDRTNWPNFADAKLASDLNTFYSVQANDTNAGAMVRRIQDIVGISVTNDAGETLGKIEDIVINPQSGAPQYAALSFGGFLGFGGKLFAIPWSELKLHEDAQSHAVMAEVNVKKESLDKAPSFDKDHWPDFADPHWARDVDAHYGPRAS